MVLLETRKPSKTQRNFPKVAKISAADALTHLKKHYELLNNQSKSYAEECKRQIETNQETIRKLRIEISEARILSRSARTNEYLMRQALVDHHSGSSIFREREPKEVNENVDFKLSDLQNKLNRLRHGRNIKNKRLQDLLRTFNESVSDVAYFEYEGPMGDTQCLAIENKISENDKKFAEAETIGNTYRHIRDKLTAECNASHSVLNAINKLLRHKEEEVSKCKQSVTAAVKGKQTAATEVFKAEFDLHSSRRDRKIELIDFKRKTEEEKHDFATLWRTIQAHFASQESVPLPHMHYHSRLSISSYTELHDGSGPFEYSEEEIGLIKHVTGSHTVPEVAERYENQESTYQYSKSLVNELEQKKLVLLQKLEELHTIRSSLLHRAETEEDAQLRQISGEPQTSHGGRWSRLAAHSRVTQTLARLRQLLEYLTAAFVSADLIQQPPDHDLSDTEGHLRQLLAAASTGVTALMSSLHGTEPEEAQRAAVTADFLMTRSELHVLKPRAQLERDTAGDDIGYVGTDGDTTGDDAVPTRAAIKRQAHLILMARQKSGSRNKRR